MVEERETQDHSQLRRIGTTVFLCFSIGLEACSLMCRGGEIKIVQVGPRQHDAKGAASLTLSGQAEGGRYTIEKFTLYNR